MNRKDAIEILREGKLLTDEAALLLLLVKYSGKMTAKDLALIEAMRFCCPLCEIHCKESLCQDNGDCPWIRFTEFTSESRNKACIKWRQEHYKGINVNFIELPADILAKRVAMIKDWLKIIRKA